MKNFFIFCLFINLLFFNTACSFVSTPRDKYLSELDNYYKDLISILQSPPVDGKSQVTSAISYNKSTEYAVSKPDNMSIDLPWAVNVIDCLSKIKNHYQNVPYTLINQDLSGFDKWASKIKKLYTEKNSEIEIITKKIETDFIKDPSKYISQSLLFGGQNLSIIDGKLYFRDPMGADSGYIKYYNIHDELSFNIDTWTDNIKKLTSTNTNQKESPQVQ